MTVGQHYTNIWSAFSGFWVDTCDKLYLIKQKTLSQCCYNGGPPSATLAQHYNSIAKVFVWYDIPLKRVTLNRFCFIAGLASQSLGQPLVNIGSTRGSCYMIRWNGYILARFICRAGLCFRTDSDGILSGRCSMTLNIQGNRITIVGHIFLPLTLWALTVH